MTTAQKECSWTEQVIKAGTTDAELLMLYQDRPAAVRRAIKSLYDELSTFEHFERPCNFVLDMFPGLTSVLQYSKLRCLHLDVIEPLGDKLLAHPGNSYSRDIIGYSSFQYHTLREHFNRIPKMMYDRVISSETHNIRGYPLLAQAIDSLTIGGRIYLFGLELRDERLLATASNERVTEYLRIS